MFIVMYVLYIKKFFFVNFFLLIGFTGWYAINDIQTPCIINYNELITLWII